MQSQSYSARRAVPFWLILSLPEHQGALLGSKAKKQHATHPQKHLDIYMYMYIGAWGGI
jgi:hypothetical protein